LAQNIITSIGSAGNTIDPKFVSALDREISPRVVALNVMRALTAPSRSSFTIEPKVGDVPVLGWLSSEIERKPVTDASFTSRPTVEMRKMAAITVHSQLTEDLSFLNFRAEMRRLLVDSASRQLDRALWHGRESTNAGREPYGFVSQAEDNILPNASYSGDLPADMAAAVRALAIEEFKGTSWVMRPEVLLKLQLIEDNQGLPKFPEVRGSAPQFLGIPIVTTGNLLAEPTTDGQTSAVCLADWNGASGGFGVRVWQSPSSLLESETASFVDSDGQTHHSYQEDLVLWRLFLYVSDVTVTRPESTYTILGVEA
jgi:HK97 family phage major capsid protein